MAYYDRWKPRSMDSFEKFVTENDERIDYRFTWCQVSVQKLERECRIFKQQRLFEKVRAIAQYKLPMHGLVWTFNTGAFFSRDDGKLFKCGAETELDCVKGQDIDNRGNGYFVDVNVAKNTSKVALLFQSLMAFGLKITLLCTPTATRF